MTDSERIWETIQQGGPWHPKDCNPIIIIDKALRVKYREGVKDVCDAGAKRIRETCLSLTRKGLKTIAEKLLKENE